MDETLRQPAAPGLEIVETTTSGCVVDDFYSTKDLLWCLCNIDNLKAKIEARMRKNRWAY